MKTATLVLSFISFMFLTNLTAGTYTEKKSAQIDSIISLQHSEEQPGGVLAVISKGDIAEKKCFGIMNTENNKAIDKNTLFDIASVAKQFTAFSILLLEKDGQIDLDSDIREYLSYLPEYDYEITIRNLIQHTSGIASTDWLRLLSGIPFDVKWTHQDEIDIIKKYSRLNFKPNTKHVYSNAGYSLLASIVEEVSGMTFPQFLSKEVFKPLGMKTAIIYDSHQDEQLNRATGYEIVDEKAEAVSSSEEFSYGSGNIYASINDMITWGNNFFSPKVGDKNIIDRMLNKYNVLENGDSISYTYGLYVGEYKGVKMVSHSGGIPGFRSQFMIFPEDELIVIVMLNNESINSRTIATSVAEIYLADRIMEKEVAQRVETDLNLSKIENYIGNYTLPDGMEFEFVLEKDTFWLHLPGDHKFQLFAESDNEFFLKDFDAQVTFIEEPNGNVNEMIWHQGGEDYHATRTVDRVPLTTEEKAKFAGDYYHKDLKTDYKVVFDDNKLVLNPPETFERYFGAKYINLNHVNGDIFATDMFGMVEFTRDEKNEINGFILLNIGRLQNVEFLKR